MTSTEADGMSEAATDRHTDAFGEIQSREDDLRRAMLAGDVAGLSALLDDHLVFTAPDGSLLNKEQDLAAHETGLLKLDEIEITEVSFHRVGELILTATRASLSGAFAGTAFTGLFAYTRLWSRSSGSSRRGRAREHHQFLR